MGAKKGQLLYRCASTGLVRTTPHAGLPIPPWPDLTGATPEHTTAQRGWLAEVWAVREIADAVGHASPELARRVRALTGSPRPDAPQVRRASLATARYLLRMTGRATPFGMMAGVASMSFGREPSIGWGTSHRAVAQADASWLASVITRLESCPPLRERLPLLANNTSFLRGRRLVVPYQPQPHGDQAITAAEVSIRHTPAVRLAVEAARSPARFGELAAKLAAEFPTATPTAINRLLTSLLEQRVLISSLHAPSTVTDALGHLISQLDSVDAYSVTDIAGLTRRLGDIHAGLARHNRATAAESRRLRTTLAAQMSEVSGLASHPLAVDLRLDCTLTLPLQVAREAEAAASALARITAYPSGAVSWQDYHIRFFERYGVGALVPVLDVVNPDAGLGFPAGYPGSPPEPAAPLSARDRRLLTLAQDAALDGHDEITLDDDLITGLASTPSTSGFRAPPHLELCLEVRSASAAALGRGEFDLVIVSVSRAAGTLTGRFTSVLPPDSQACLGRVITGLPTSGPRALPAQLSVPPLNPAAAHVTRVPPLLPSLISLGEHTSRGSCEIRLEDLAVGCDSERLYLASVSQGRLVEPVMLNALDLRAHTPPLARFLAEISRAQAAVVTGFDWGAASRLPFLPRVRYRRTVLATARWQLDPASLPGRHAPWPAWDQAISAWRASRRVPRVVCLAEGDRRLRLDLSQPAHRVLLRARLDSTGPACLTEAPAPGDDDWFGGRAHEIVVTLTATQPPRWPPAPMITTARLASRDSAHPPGASSWLYAKLYGHPQREPEIIGEYLPELLAGWDKPPLWWFIRYRDPRYHLRLRIALASAEQFGATAQRVSTWAARLRRLGLLSDIEFATYHPETGRWGSGAVMAAAEDVFSADSRALAAQFAQSAQPHPQALAAAHFVAIAAGFTGSAGAGMRWLARHARTTPATAPARQVLNEAVRIAAPHGDWAALRAAPGGQPITAAFGARREALARYRALLTSATGPDRDAVLVSLLHAHHIRAAGIDPDGERTCLHLTRAAALSWQARTSSSTP
jgi:thiopeptide-type bacteriocin biosynthesis protein